MNDSVAPSSDAGAGPEHPVTRIQTDIFCQDCGGNLYNRPVWRTEETDLLVSSCEHCGKIASANEALPYRRVWRQRLGVAMMIAWMALLGGALATVVTIEFAIQMVVPKVEYERSSPYGYGNSYRDREALSLDWEETRDEMLWAIPLSVLLTFTCGCLLTCVVYHWRMEWHLFAAFVIPLIATGFVMLERSPYLRSRIRVAAPAILVLLAVQIAAGMVGVLIGRPVSRGVLRVLLPNRSRKFFAFLWRRDGKEMPMGPF